MTAVPAPTVAVLNGSAEVMALVQLVLEGEGYRTVAASLPTAEDDRETLALLRDHAPQVVLYGIDPPYEEGWRRFEAVRRLAPPTRRFVVTTTDPNAASGYAAGGAVPIVTMPFEIDDLLATVRAALERLREPTRQRLRQARRTIETAEDLLGRTRGGRRRRV